MSSSKLWFLLVCSCWNDSEYLLLVCILYILSPEIVSICVHISLFILYTGEGFPCMKVHFILPFVYLVAFFFSLFVLDIFKCCQTSTILVPLFYLAAVLGFYYTYTDVCVFLCSCGTEVLYDFHPKEATSLFFLMCCELDDVNILYAR